MKPNGDDLSPIVADTLPIQMKTSGVHALADRVARRLHSELSTFLSALPREARNASELARRLGIDRTTCQRAVFVASRPFSGSDVLARLPGVRGLRQLCDAAAKSSADESAVAALLAAIDQFEELLRDFGGSQSRLVRELQESDERAPARADGISPEDPGEVAARRRLFDAATEITGRSSNCWVAVYVYRPNAGDASTLELIRANGLVGHSARADAVPLIMHNFTTKLDAESAPAEPPGIGRVRTLDNAPLRPRAFDSLLPEFTSDPPPLIRTRQPNDFLVQSIDEPASAAGRRTDIMMATRTVVPNPAHHAPPIEEAWALVNFPCRHLVFDLYLHRDLARSCIPSLDAHLWRPDFAQQVGDRWQTRFTDSPVLQLLGPGLRAPPTRAYPRLGELTKTVFSRAGIPGEEFVGYRCEVAYPIWRAGYCVSFDFTRPAAD